MARIKEDKIQFDFGESWSVMKYDGHADYRNGIQKLQSLNNEENRGTKAVDILGIIGDELYFIEIKDFRDYRIENKPRIGKDLAIEMALKVRDTVAGISGACRVSSTTEDWRLFAEGLIGKRMIRMVLWMEEDSHYPSAVERNRHKARQSVLLEELKKQCKWITKKVSVTSQALQSTNNILPKVTVRIDPSPKRRSQ